MNYFGTLFVLLNKSDNNNKKEFDQNAISTMQTKFETLISTYSPEKCPHFIDDVTDLIYYSDLKKVNLESFTNEYVQVMLNNETVSNIYQLLPKKYKDISKNLNNINGIAVIDLKYLEIIQYIEMPNKIRSLLLTKNNNILAGSIFNVIQFKFNNGNFEAIGEKEIFIYINNVIVEIEDNCFIIGSINKLIFVLK
jgi:hypothetical protein